MTLRQLPRGERPRERLVRYGSTALANAELLAILIQTGDAGSGTSALDLAHRILSKGAEDAGGADRELRYLARVSVEELSRIRGIGVAKATQIKAAVELGRRVARDVPGERPFTGSPEDVARLIQDDLWHLEQEQLWALLVDVKNRMITKELVSVGDLNSSMAHPREVFKAAIRKNAHAVILVHNHPSGDPSPSTDDILATRRLAEAGRLLGIEVHDHLIFAGKDYYSFRRQGISF